MSKNKILVFVGLFALLVVLYFFLPRTATHDHEGHDHENAKHSSFDINLYTKQALAIIPGELKTRIQLLDSLSKKAKGPELNELNRQLALSWDSSMMFGAAAIYYEKLSQEDGSSNSWAITGTRYLAAFDMSQDSVERAFLGQKAKNAFDQALKIAPNNLDIKADLAKTVVLTSTESPMQGIQMLRDITTQNPNHLKANLNLGQLAIRSGQFEKAKSRFELLVKKYPQFPDAYLGLGECSLALGDTSGAVNALTDYKALVKDPVVLEQVDLYLQQLNKK